MNSTGIHVTHILCKQKLLFWMRLIAINRFTALIYIYVTVHTAGRDEEHADEEVLQNNSL